MGRTKGQMIRAIMQNTELDDVNTLTQVSNARLHELYRQFVLGRTRVRSDDERGLDQPSVG